MDRAGIRGTTGTTGIVAGAGVAESLEERLERGELSGCHENVSVESRSIGKNGLYKQLVPSGKLTYLWKIAING